MAYEAVILRKRLVYVAVSAVPQPLPSKSHWFTIDDKLVYWNFFLDFGPLNLGQLYRFCAMLNEKLRDVAADKTIYYYASSHPHQRTNGAFMIGAWQILYLGLTPDEAYASIAHFDLEPFHDATPGVCTFRLEVLDCLKGLYKARHYDFFRFETFSLPEYEYFEAVENGDLNWIVQDKIFAFAGPHDADANTDGYRALRPEHFVPYFARKDVSLIVRLNKPYYRASTFTNMGADFADLYYLDGSNPPLHILKKFIAIAEHTRGAFGVHCKAGLGRTGTCIGSYLMKHYKFTAEEIIGWMRICRPGCVIGPQQHFLKDMEHALWREGDAFRSCRGLNPVPVDLFASAQASSPRVAPSGGPATAAAKHASPRHRSSSKSRVIPSPLPADDATALSKRIVDLDIASGSTTTKNAASSQGDELRRRRHQTTCH